jgi:hypothetical protein
MREAGDFVERNQVGQAAGLQSRIAASLREVLDLLANRREHELGRLVAKLREAEQELSALRAQQQGLEKKLRDAAENTDPQEQQRQLERLVREQKKVQEEIERMARQLKRLQADRARRSAERGAAHAGQAGESARAGDAASAQEQAAQAKKDLDEAQAQLAEARRQAEADLAHEQLARFEDAVQGLVDRQQEIIARTVEAEELKDQQSARIRAAALQDLARLEEMLREETAGHGENISEAEVFRVALAGAAAEMGRAVELLRGRESGATTQRAERDALARLEQLVKAFGNDDEQKADSQEGEEGGSGEGGASAGRLRNLSELKLLKLLQEDLNRRTRELAEEPADTDEGVQDRFARLSEEQGRLADLVFDLLRPDYKASDEDDPEKLPDIRRPAADDDLPPLNLEGN